jgi:hypothetical protein
MTAPAPAAATGDARQFGVAPQEEAQDIESAR